MEMQLDWPMHMMPPLNPVIAAPSGCLCVCVCVCVCVYVCELKKASNLKTLVNNWTCSWRHGMMPHTVFPQALMILLQDTCRMAQTPRGCKASSTARSPPNRKMQWAVGSVCLCISVLQQPVCSIFILFRCYCCHFVNRFSERGDRKQKKRIENGWDRKMITRSQGRLYIFYEVANSYDLARNNLYVLWKKLCILWVCKLVGIRTNGPT